MSEISAEYRDRVERLRLLNEAVGQLRREEAEIVDFLATSRAATIRPTVAALLGDTVVDEHTKKTHRLAEVRRSLQDHQAALTLQRNRISDARVSAGAAVCKTIRPEYGRRVAALIRALEGADEARRHLSDLTDTLERDDVSWLSLGVFKANFLGDAVDGHIPRMALEAKGFGYVA